MSCSGCEVLVGGAGFDIEDGDNVSFALQWDEDRVDLYLEEKYKVTRISFFSLGARAGRGEGGGTGGGGLNAPTPVSPSPFPSSLSLSLFSDLMSCLDEPTTAAWLFCSHDTHTTHAQTKPYPCVPP